MLELSSGFQNIVCYCLSQFAQKYQLHRPYFKTSYVTVYPRSHWKQPYNFKISKHRMLLFIFVTISFLSDLTSFQNIVCYCLSYVRCCHIQKDGISKHRMLLFIRRGESAGRAKYKFQNIVCYCLSGLPLSFSQSIYISKHRRLLFILKPLF